MGLHDGKNPFHKTKSTQFGGISFSMKCLGDTSPTESRNSEKVDCFFNTHPCESSREKAVFYENIFT
jgi:hypothetical protein